MMRNDLDLDALEQALNDRDTDALLVHQGDRGSQHDCDRSSHRVVLLGACQVAQRFDNGARGECHSWSCVTASAKAAAPARSAR